MSYEKLLASIQELTQDYKEKTIENSITIATQGVEIKAIQDRLTKLENPKEKTKDSGAKERGMLYKIISTLIAIIGAIIGYVIGEK